MAIKPKIKPEPDFETLYQELLKHPNGDIVVDRLKAFLKAVAYPSAVRGQQS